MTTPKSAEEILNRIIQFAKDTGNVTPEEYQTVAKSLGFEIKTAQIRCPRIDAKSGKVLEHSTIKIEVLNDTVFLSANSTKTVKLWRMTKDQWERLSNPGKGDDDNDEV